MRGKIQLQGSYRLLVSFLLALGLAGAPLACGSKTNPSAVRALPEYDAEQATLFGDVFRPELFGLGSERSVGVDGLLRDRATVADTVVAARVVTVSRETRGAARGYSVVLAPTENALVGPTPSGQLTFEIVETSPVFGWLEGASGAWGGTRMLLFLRQFRDGTHFFGCADTEDVRTVVASAPRRRANPAP
ncbi:MAG TPA: hypothetical protein VFQ35_11235 [Polyangiaceae bacterium]|nr:hypothetical protein [Polyangiaceae bacterium]